MTCSPCARGRRRTAGVLLRMRRHTSARDCTSSTPPLPARKRMPGSPRGHPAPRTCTRSTLRASSGWSTWRASSTRLGGSWTRPWQAVRRPTRIATDVVQLPSVAAERRPPRVFAIVLAGGEGKRLAPLTKDRAKPAVPFGGVYRLIDFALSNLVNGGYLRIAVLTQYKSHSLDRHISQTWRLSP